MVQPGPMWRLFNVKGTNAELLNRELLKQADHQETLPENCFCQLKGNIDDCECEFQSVNMFNNYKMHARIMSLLKNNYFRFFRVNLDKPCPFWIADGGCRLKSCAVEVCTPGEIPPGIVKKSSTILSSVPELCAGDDQTKQELSFVNSTLSAKTLADVQLWNSHDLNLYSYCDIDDEENDDSVFVDLLLNPERYTGYEGESAHKVWRAIYEENCFQPKREHGLHVDSTNVRNMCLEKRAFYRSISGLHTSISVHLCSEYLLKRFDISSLFASKNFSPAENQWGPNVDEFHRRFDPNVTNGEGPKWLRNLYFLYLLELRAIAKVAPFLEHHTYYTGDAMDDAEVSAAIRELLPHITGFKHHFNESLMFNGAEALELKEEFREHFRNISRIMDCVGCNKCKLWGKLQIQGLGTTMKILFSESLDQLNSMESDVRSNETMPFQLTRTEIVALFNSFGRLSNSIYQIGNLKKTVNSPIL